MPQTYNFEHIGINNNEYAFVTSNELIYNIAFVKADFYFPEHLSFKQNVFELIIQLDESQKNTRAIRDPKLPPTIAAIFLDFFYSNEHVVVFSCDTTDRKQAVRHRKFDDWFKQFNDDSFIKLNEIIDDIENESQYFMSMILVNTNPLKDEIIEAFRELKEALLNAK
jgi:hypothetical protein